MPLSPGTRLGPYEITSALGAGGMGEVYRARDARLGREVAIKVLPASRSGTPEAEARFEREARAIAAVSHPNICAIYDVGSHNGLSFLVLELLEGESLHDRLTRGPLDLVSSLDLAIALSDAVDLAHARGLLHRDLKPANIFLTSRGQVKILDFGLAKVLEDAEAETRAAEVSLTEGGTTVGTVGYMPPEQLRGDIVDARADVFALGAVLYEMATGHRAFQGRTAAVIADAVLHGRPRRPSELRPELPLSLDAAIMGALEKDAEVRCQSAGDLRAQLRRVKREMSGAQPTPGQHVHELAAQEVAPATVQQGARAPVSSDAAVVAGLAKRHPLLAAGATLALATAIGASWWFRSSTDATPPPSPTEASAAAAPPMVATNSIAVLPFADLSPNQDQEYFSDGLAEEVLNQLTRVPDLQVIARTSSFSFKGKADDIRSIADKLNVAHVLQGSVRKAGYRLRVTTQLIRADTGVQVWSENYDRELEGVFEVQDEIASKVVAALQVRLNTGQPGPQRPTSVDAYAQYLLGRQAYVQFTVGALRKAAEAYRRAIALDPNYGAAHAELAMSIFSLADATNDKASFGSALVMAEKAVALTPDGTTYGVRGYLRSVVAWDWAGALADLDRAVVLSPGDSLIRVRHSTVLNGVGRSADGLAAAQKAFQLDPLSAFARSSVGLGLLRARRLEEARVMFTSDGGPPLPGTLANLGTVLLELGRAAEALEAFRQMPAESYLRLRGITAAQHTLGRRRESQEALDELIERHGTAQPLYIASVYAWRGETDQAFQWIDRAIRERDTLIPRSFRNMTAFDSLRRDPRYPALLKRIGFPD